MIKLKNVSKYYYNKGIITSGFTKANLELNLGEFVAITGESGSGKSTLLNVISGLDSYEDGEMYINGEETSHYSETDFENYRRKYISNIFQNFNLVNSYTVYQNIELVLLINGMKKRKVKKQVLDLIRKVDLYKYRNTKVSKLSGGQKQRVAIARALAKNTPIIIADEPTGNLDKKSAASVLRTLKEVSNDKLVIIVTHNYDQIEEYATRKITMYDGKIIEDKEIKKTSKAVSIKSEIFKPMRFMSELILGIRNSINIIPKFILLLLVFLLMISAIILENASLKKAEAEESNFGYNYYFQNPSKSRIMIQKSDMSAFTDEDYDKIKELDNVDVLIKNDLELDTYASFNNDKESIYFDGAIKNISSFNGNVKYGRMPKSDDEILVTSYEDNYYISDYELILDKSVSYYDYYTWTTDSKKYKIVGIAVEDNDNYSYNIYVSDKLQKDIGNKTLMSKFIVSEIVNNNTLTAGIIPLDNIDEGTAYITDQYSYACKNYSCKNSKISVNIKGLYFDKNIDLKITKELSRKKFKDATGLNYDDSSFNIFISTKDYEKIIGNDCYQSSVMVKNHTRVHETKNELEKLGFKATALVDVLVNDSEVTRIYNIINLIVTIILLIVLFIISYLIIKIILKSRHTYFACLRILGANKKHAKKILEIELFTVFNIAFIILLVLIYLINNDIIMFDALKDMLYYMNNKAYIYIYIIILIMTYLISQKFASYIFKKSAMKTYNEEVL